MEFWMEPKFVTKKNQTEGSLTFDDVTIMDDCP
jgi:hypothetical protein